MEGVPCFCRHLDIVSSVNEQKVSKKIGGFEKYSYLCTKIKLKKGQKNDNQLRF